jgi:putative transposase
VEKEKQLETALFRYMIIAPLLEPGVDRAELSRRRKEILGREYRKPNGKLHRYDERMIRLWVEKYRKNGFEGLYPKRRSDQGTSKVLSAEVLTRACQLKTELPERSVRQILDILKSEQIVGIKPSTLARHFGQQGLMNLPKKPKTGFRRFRKEHRNCLWQSDLKYGPYLPDPKNPKKTRQTYLIAFIDDYSRLVPYAQFYFNENLPALEDCLKKAIIRRGIPDNIYVDNGKIFVSQHFKLACAKLNIRHSHTKPYSPEAKGKIERFFGYVESSFMPECRALKFKTLEELNEHFWAWLEEGYNHKPHSALHGTPAQVFAEDNQRLRVATPLEIYEAFLQETERTVDKTGCFKLAGRLIEAGAAVAGEKVLVRYDPYDNAIMEIWHKGQKITNQEITPSNDPTNGTESHIQTNYLISLAKRQAEKRKERFGAIAFRELEGDGHV